MNRSSPREDGGAGRRDERAASSVVGVVLMVAIVVVIGSVVTVFALGIMFNQGDYGDTIDELTDGDLVGDLVGSALPLAVAGRPAVGRVTTVTGARENGPTNRDSS